jgi:hypothetical protein
MVAAKSPAADAGSRSLGHAPSILAAHDLVERLRRPRPRIETPLALPSDSLSEDNWSDVGGMA